KSPTTITVERMPLGDVLTRVLMPLELDYRVVGKNLIQVTGAEELRRRLRIEFYPIADLLHGTQPVADTMRQITTSGDGGTIAWQAAQFDAPSFSLVVLADETTHRELERALSRTRQFRPADERHSVLKPPGSGRAP